MTKEIVSQFQPIQQAQTQIEGSSKVVGAILEEENRQAGKYDNKRAWDEWDDVTEWLDIE